MDFSVTCYPNSPDVVASQGQFGKPSTQKWMLSKGMEGLLRKNIYRKKD